MSAGKLGFLGGSPEIFAQFPGMRPDSRVFGEKAGLAGNPPPAVAALPGALAGWSGAAAGRSGAVAGR